MADALSLLRRHDATELLAEHLRWEALAVDAPHYDPVRHRGRTKTVIILNGMPGAGKSTTCAWLAPALGADFFSMARFAEGRGVSSAERFSHQLATERPHVVDTAFLVALVASPARHLLVEKFPVTVVEAAALLAYAHAHTWALEVLHFELPSDCIELSVARQLARGPQRGRAPERQDARRRALTHAARTATARRLLRAQGVPIHGFDMTRPAPEVRTAIRRSLHIDPAALRWHLPTLEVLASVSGALGIDAYLANGSFYRPFWNDRFGPMQVPTDADVAVNDPWEVEPLYEALVHAAPEERWSVVCPSSRLEERLRVVTKGVAEAKSLAAFLHRTGLVRRYRGEIELVMPREAEAALWNGVMRLNPLLMERLDAGQRAVLLARYAERLPAVLERYPGLTVEPETARLLKLPVAGRDAIGSGFTALKARVLADARPTRELHCRRKLTSEELAVAQEILAFHRESARDSHAPPRPRKPAQPLTPAPLIAMARDADDQTFAAWLLDQQRPDPQLPHDPELRALLRFDFTTKARGGPRVATTALGPLHQGWTLERHLIESVVQLETDDLVAKLCAPDLRLCMRFAMLYHDVGKVFGDRPARHPQMSARLFVKHRPKSFPADCVRLTEWMIRVHDVFGAFTRGLTDKVGRAAGDYEVEPNAPSSYYGAIDAQEARARLRGSGRALGEAVAIAKALWCADVAAIAALRWVMPVAGLVERLLVMPDARGADLRKNHIIL